jgi:hypothetical protein
MLTFKHKSEPSAKLPTRAGPFMMCVDELTSNNRLPSGKFPLFHFINEATWIRGQCSHGQNEYNALSCPLGLQHGLPTTGQYLTIKLHFNATNSKWKHDFMKYESH